MNPLCWIDQQGREKKGVSSFQGTAPLEMDACFFDAYCGVASLLTRGDWTSGSHRIGLEGHELKRV